MNPAIALLTFEVDRPFVTTAFHKGGLAAGSPFRPRLPRWHEVNIQSAKSAQIGFERVRTQHSGSEVGDLGVTRAQCHDDDSGHGARISKVQDRQAVAVAGPQAESRRNQRRSGGARRAN